MNLKRVTTLVSREFASGGRSFIFIFAVVIPVLLSLLISLMVGTLFAGKPRLGIADAGASQLTQNMLASSFVAVKQYDSVDILKQEVERGAADIGIVIPVNFDADLKQDSNPNFELYIWGESLLKHRTVLGVAIIRELIDLSGREVPAEIVTTLLGEDTNVSWDLRLFPLIVVITIIMGGTMIPATSLVTEKQKRTLKALIVSPASFTEILLAKGITGTLVSFVMGIAILALNRAFGAQPVLLLAVLFLSASMAAGMGVIMGVLIKDINTLFTTLKGLGIFLYAPAIFYLFPDLPSWISRLFPTHYMVSPIVEMSLYGAQWAQISGEVYILLALIVVTIGLVKLLANRALQNDAL